MRQDAAKCSCFFFWLFLGLNSFMLMSFKLLNSENYVTIEL